MVTASLQCDSMSLGDVLASSHWMFSQFLQSSFHGVMPVTFPVE